MRRIFVLLIAVLLSTTFWAQSPEKMSYQAVVRDAGNKLVTSSKVGMQISILAGSVTGSSVYAETQIATTNANGLVSVEIGNGTVQTGSFENIDWANGPYFIKTEIDPNGGLDYSITGISQLLSVPYALHAKSAEKVDAETDPLFISSTAASIKESDTIKWNNKLDSYKETDPIFISSDVANITKNDIKNWNSKISSYTEKQTLKDVAALGNSVSTQLKFVVDPTDPQDAATKAYVTLRVSKTGDTLFLGSKQWIIIPGISAANSISDVVGNTYKYVTIGNQVWFAENLKTNKYNDGTPIPLVTDNATWKSLSTPGYCWYNNDMVTYGNTYGALYNWYTVNSGKLCPSGWHVSTDADWVILDDFLGGYMIAGGKLKETGKTHWTKTNYYATNEVGFTAIPGGFRWADSGNFDFIGESSRWWSSTESSTEKAYAHSVFDDSKLEGRSIDLKQTGQSVRCVKN